MLSQPHLALPLSNTTARSHVQTQALPQARATTHSLPVGAMQSTIASHQPAPPPTSGASAASPRLASTPAASHAAPQQAGTK